MKRVGKVISGVVTGFLVVWLFATALLNVPVLASYTLTNSMKPVINIGDLFLIQPYHPTIDFLSTVAQGDIVVFRSTSGMYLVHRIIGATPRGFITKGDNSPFTDQQGSEPVVTREQIMGKVLTVHGTPLIIPQAGLWLRQASLLVRTNTIVIAGALGVTSLLLFFHDKHSLRSLRRPRRSRTQGIKMKHLYLLALVTLFLMTSIPMIAGMTTHHIAYVVTAQPVDATRTTVEGGILKRTLIISNTGLIPIYLFFSSPDTQVELEATTVLQYPGPPTEIEVSVQAESAIGYYTKDVYILKYLPILPLPLLTTLNALHPWLPLVVIETMLLSPFVILYFFLDQRSLNTRVQGGRVKRRKRGWM